MIIYLQLYFFLFTVSYIELLCKAILLAIKKAGLKAQVASKLLYLLSLLHFYNLILNDL